MKTITTLINEIDQRDCDNYQGFLSDIRSNFNKMVSDGNTPLFTTNVDDLYESFPFWFARGGQAALQLPLLPPFC